MKEQLQQLVRNLEAMLDGVLDAKTLERIRYDFLGRNGKLAHIAKQIKNVPADGRKEMGQLLNEVKQKLTTLISQKEARVSTPASSTKEFIDYTLPGTAPRIGGLHPLTIFIDRIVLIFENMGFEVVDGNEVETQNYNFDFLNIPQDHPARDIQDTFFLDNPERWVLRTHTSNMQIRAMETRKPPVRIVSPGRVYRNEATDASHDSTFYQVEAFVIDRNVRLTDLLGTLTLFLERLYGNIRVRFRPDYYPFVEPGLDVDMSCLLCKGEGCPVCKKTGWLEVLGSGMIHPVVLRNMKLDPKKWNGFAFGMGVDRLMALYYGVDDIRLSYQGDLRFLKQFSV